MWSLESVMSLSYAYNQNWNKDKSIVKVVNTFLFTTLVEQKGVKIVQLRKCIFILQDVNFVEIEFPLKSIILSQICPLWMRNS